MRKIILQHAVAAQKSILDLVKPINQTYADNIGFEYLTDDTSRCPDRSYYWEKIAYIQSLLPDIEDGSLIMWEDADSINIRNESPETVLPTGSQLGMVQNRGGSGGMTLLPWYNTGVMMFYNSSDIRDFFQRAWNRNGVNDEVAIVEEYKTNGGIDLVGIDPKWNCWLNNRHICTEPVIQTFHGMRLQDKLEAMQKAISENPAFTKVKKKKIKS